MASKAKNGVWPVMLTPFTESGRVDYTALEALIHWYEKAGVDGLFAVCQSSEMFLLSLKERVELARFIKKTAAVPVIASGGAGKMEDFKELFKIHGVDAGLAASIFHFKEVSIADLKNYLRENGIPMRIL